MGVGGHKVPPSTFSPTTPVIPKKPYLEGLNLGDPRIQAIEKKKLTQ